MEQPTLVSFKQVKSQRFRARWLSLKEDHFSYQSPIIPKDLQENLGRQGLVLAIAIGWADRRNPGKADRMQAHAVRVATLQSITEAFAKEVPTDFDLEADTPKEPSGSGKE